MPFKNELELIFGKSTATGAFARSRGRRSVAEAEEEELVEWSESHLSANEDKQEDNEDEENNDNHLEEEDLMNSIESGTQKSSRLLKRYSTEPLSSSLTLGSLVSLKRLKQLGSADFNRAVSLFSEVMTSIKEDRRKVGEKSMKQ